MSGHGVKGNEGAHRLDGMAIVENGQAIDWADILNALREAGCTRDSSDDCDAETMNRQLEHNAK